MLIGDAMSPLLPVTNLCLPLAPLSSPLPVLQLCFCTGLGSCQQALDSPVPCGLRRWPQLARGSLPTESACYQQHGVSAARPATCKQQGPVRPGACVGTGTAHTSTCIWKQHASRTLALFTSALTVRACHAHLLCTGSSSTTTCRECHPGSSAGTSRCQRCVISTCTYPVDCSAPVAHPLHCGALLTGRCCV